MRMGWLDNQGPSRCPPQCQSFLAQHIAYSIAYSIQIIVSRLRIIGNEAVGLGTRAAQQNEIKHGVKHSRVDTLIGIPRSTGERVTLQLLTLGVESLRVWEFEKHGLSAYPVGWTDSLQHIVRPPQGSHLSPCHLLVASYPGWLQWSCDKYIPSIYCTQGDQVWVWVKCRNGKLPRP